VSASTGLAAATATAGTAAAGAAIVALADDVRVSLATGDGRHGDDCGRRGQKAEADTMGT
jgi:hypothetical protein